MLLHDALDDCKAQSGAFLARGHVGLGEAVTILLREADAIVRHGQERRSIRKAVEEATRCAQPVTRVAPRSVYTQAVRDFVARLLEVEPEETQKVAAKGLLARLRGG